MCKRHYDNNTEIMFEINEAIILCKNVNIH